MSGRAWRSREHVVVGLVDEAGRAVSVHLDRPRAQKCARELERRHGLRVVEGRDRGRGVRSTNYRQAKRAQRDHDRNALRVPSPEPDRERLERAVRIASAAADSEADFVRRIRDGGRLLIRPRFAAGCDDQVVGYSVALRPAQKGREAVPAALTARTASPAPGTGRSDDSNARARSCSNRSQKPVGSDDPSRSPTRSAMSASSIPR